MPLLMRTAHCPHSQLGFTCQSKIGCSLSPLSRLCCCWSGCCRGSARRGGNGRCREAPGRLPPVSGAPAVPEDRLPRLATMPQTHMMQKPTAPITERKPGLMRQREAYTQRSPGAQGSCELRVWPASEVQTLQQQIARSGLCAPPEAELHLRCCRGDMAEGVRCRMEGARLRAPCDEIPADR